MLNVITIQGRLTKEPELRTTQNGVTVATFTVACEQDFVPQGGERGADFIDCVAWRGCGEFVCKYFQKGSMIVVTGRLQSRKWEDRDGNKRTSWEVNAGNVYFGSEKKRDEDNGPRARGDAYDSDYIVAQKPVNVDASDYADGRQGTFEELGDDGELPF